ncbi:MAG: hypothetical protein KC468_39245, partial [Myxococcales bacterium]|nr:hypothetical protein [Myxococcales bacterium]
AGLPGRRLRLRVSTLDGEGRVLARRELQYGRALVDEQGAPAAFIRARAVADDQRLYPESPRLERLEFTGDERGARARVELEFLELDPAIEAALELAPVAPQLIARSELALDGRRRGRAR